MDTRTLGALSRRTSLRDVAKLAGVSAAAVSYVVTGRTGEVGSQTLEKIELAIKELNYKPQRRGLSLKFNKEFAIGFVVVDPNPNFLADPFTTQIATGLSNALMEPGFGLTVIGCNGVDALDRLIRRPIGVDAFMVVASGPTEIREQLYCLLGSVDLPLVVVQEEAPASVTDACGILQDDFEGAQLLANHLVACGATRVLFVAPSCAWPAIERRERGIRSVLLDRASVVTVRCEEQDFEATFAAIDRYLGATPIPDAIVGANDQIAIAALRVLEQRGIVVPTTIQVTGYNDFPFRNFIRPLLTTVRSAANEIGRSCAQAILQRLSNEAFQHRVIKHGVTLDIGGTTLQLPAKSARRMPRSALPTS